MPRDERRRLTLWDVMIVIAATAPGLAYLRDFLSALLSSGEGSLEFSIWVALGTFPVATCWSVALLVLRLRWPRPTWRRLTRQPGLIASMAATLGSILGGLFVLSVWPGSFHPPDLVLLALWPIGSAVAASWLTLFVSGRWRAEPSLLDRLGRLLGGYWIALLFVFILTTYFL